MHLCYLYGCDFTIQTDHQTLRYLSKVKFIDDRVMHWALYLQGFGMRIKTIQGRDNNAVELLSRSLDEGG